jgi:hypothetical protein
LGWNLIGVGINYHFIGYIRNGCNFHENVKTVNGYFSRIFFSCGGLEIQNIPAYTQPQFMERTRGELILFATAAFGVWVSIWAVILVSKWLELTSLALVLVPLACFALKDEG